MKQIRITDATLCSSERAFTFREKLEIARHLVRLRVDVIEFPEILDTRADPLLIRTASAFVKDCVLSVAAGSKNAESIELAAAALSGAAHPQIRIELPVSPVGMEYIGHKKPKMMLEWIGDAIRLAKEKCGSAVFCALDATRAEPEFLSAALKAAIDAGADGVTVSDDACTMLPDEFAGFVARVCKESSVPVSVRCSDKLGTACANAILAVKSDAAGIVTTASGDGIPLEKSLELLGATEARLGLSFGASMTELHRVISQIRWILGGGNKTAPVLQASDEAIRLDAEEDRDAVMASVAKLGYNLSPEDEGKVFEEFRRVAEKKPSIGAKELDAIVASVALQVPPTYKLENYVVNSGNIISSSAQITLEKDGKSYQGICIGDGPMDASFRALEQIVGHHYELDDFQIQSVTEGKEAVGSAIVKLRSNGKLYSGNGVSTDIVCAGIRAYLSAINKIIYEEEQA